MDIVVKELRYGSSEPINYELRDYNVSSRPVSTNVPLHRLLAMLIPSFNNYPGSQLKQRLESRGSLVELIDPVINGIVCLSQINAGLWKLNGSAADGQAYIYSHPDLCPSMKRHDLILLQTAFALTDDPGHIFMTLLHRFRLLTWANGEIDGLEIKSPDFYERNNSLADEFLSLILAIVCERDLYGIGIGSEKEEWKHRVIQTLCIDKMTHSNLASNLPELDYLDTILKEVADFDSSKKTYVLKDVYLKHYNAFYYFYNREQQSQAMEHQLRKKKKYCPPPSELTELSDIYKGLRNLLPTSPVLKMMSTVFNRDRKNPNISLIHIHKILFLISVAILDDMKEENPLFTKEAENLKLLPLLHENESKFPEVTFYCTMILFLLLFYYS